MLCAFLGVASPPLLSTLHVCANDALSFENHKIPLQWCEVFPLVFNVPEVRNGDKTGHT